MTQFGMDLDEFMASMAAEASARFVDLIHSGAWANCRESAGAWYRDELRVHILIDAILIKQDVYPVKDRSWFLAENDSGLSELEHARRMLWLFSYMDKNTFGEFMLAPRIKSEVVKRKLTLVQASRRMCTFVQENEVELINFVLQKCSIDHFSRGILDAARIYTASGPAESVYTPTVQGQRHMHEDIFEGLAEMLLSGIDVDQGLRIMASKKYAEIVFGDFMHTASNISDSLY